MGKVCERKFIMINKELKKQDINNYEDNIYSTKKCTVLCRVVKGVLTLTSLLILATILFFAGKNVFTVTTPVEVLNFQEVYADGTYIIKGYPETTPILSLQISANNFLNSLDFKNLNNSYYIEYSFDGYTRPIVKNDIYLNGLNITDIVKDGIFFPKNSQGITKLSLPKDYSLDTLKFIDNFNNENVLSLYGINNKEKLIVYVSIKDGEIDKKKTSMAILDVNNFENISLMRSKDVMNNTVSDIILFLASFRD